MISPLREGLCEQSLTKLQSTQTGGQINLIILRMVKIVFGRQSNRCGMDGMMLLVQQLLGGLLEEFMLFVKFKRYLHFEIYC